MQAAQKFVAGCWIAIALVWLISAFSTKRTKERQPLFSRLVYLWLVLVVGVLLSGKFRAVHLTRVVLRHTAASTTAGVVLVLAGFIIAVWARLVLGGNWSARVTLKEDHELIERGPYRFVRHPIYSGLLLMILGTALLSGQLAAFIALLGCFWGFWIKLRQEECLLSQRLPGYPEYMNRTAALIPFLF